MSKPVSQNIPEAETLLGLRTEDVAGFVLEHLHSLSFSSQRQNSHAGNLASQISGQYPQPYRERIGHRVREAVEWLRNENLIFNINEQSFFDFTDQGRGVKTADDFHNQFSQNRATTTKTSTDALKVFLAELNDIKASLPAEGYSKMRQRFDRWKGRCVNFIAENLSEQDANKLSRYKMLDARPRIARLRQNHVRAVFAEYQAFLEVLLDEVERYGEDYLGHRSERVIEERENATRSLPVERSAIATTQDTKRPDSTVRADELYNRVKLMYEDPRPLNESSARLIVESVDDALKEYGNTNQVKKIELKSIREECEKVLPATTIKALTERAEGIALKKIHPKTKTMRNLFYGVVILIIVISGLFGLSRFVSFGPSPEQVLSIVSPQDNEAVLAHQNTTGDGWVEVRGKISNISREADVRVYVFYQSLQDSGDGWWFYREAIPDEKGEWIVPHVWLGSESNPVTVGREYRIQAISATSKLSETLKQFNKPIPNLDVFHPVGSSIVKITIKLTVKDS